MKERKYHIHIGTLSYENVPTTAILVKQYRFCHDSKVKRNIKRSYIYPDTSLCNTSLSQDSFLNIL